MSARVDANMFIGQYPFRSVARSTAAECAAKLAALGFDRAVVSPIEAVFQEDSYAAEADLAAGIRGDDRFIHFKIVDPARPWWRTDLERAVAEFGVRGIRLCPLYHGYKLDDPRLAAVLDFAAEHDLPMLVMCRMQDIRTQRVVLAAEPETEEIAEFLKSRTHRKLILAGLRANTIAQLAGQARGRVLFDTSRLQGSWKTFETLAQRVDLSCIAFGSLWPINLPDCPFQQIAHADMDDAHREGILGGNFFALTEGDA